MAFGKIGISRSEFWDMTPREFFNAWIGWSEVRGENLEAVRNIIYGASRFNATRTAFSSEQSRATANHTFPWEKPNKDMTADEINNVLAGMG